MSDTAAVKSYAPVPGNIPGVPINLGGVMFVLAPLGLRLVREAVDRGKDIEHDGVIDEGKAFTHAVWTVHQSLLRNYPEITEDEVTALLDQGNVQEAMEKISGQSGLKRVTPGEIAPRT